MRSLLTALFLLSAITVQAASIVTAHVTVNSAPLDNAKTITWSSITRTFTNDTASSPGTLILATNSTAYTATNLLLHAISFPANPFQTYTNGPGANVFNIVGKVGETLTVTIAGGWATVAYTTNSVEERFLVAVPYSFDNATNRARIASGLVETLNDNPTNTFITNAAALVHYVTKGTAQTVSNKVVFNSYLSGVVVSNAVLHATNSYISNSALIKPSITNALWFSGVMGYATNGYWTNGVAENLVVTNFSSPGSGMLSLKLGESTFAAGDYTVAIGYATSASGSGGTALGQQAGSEGSFSTALGWGTRAYWDDATAVGAGAWATNAATSVGSDSRALFPFSSAFGFGARSTTNHQIRIGTSSNWVSIPSYIQAASSTNNTWTGTNILAGDFSAPAYSITTLGNGNNIAVDFGTNYYVRLNGTLSANSAICGIVSEGRDGQQYLVENNTGFTVTLAANTVDPTPANRIRNVSLMDLAIPPGGWFRLVFDSAISRWKVAWHYPEVSAGVAFDAHPSEPVANGTNHVVDLSRAQILITATNHLNFVHSTNRATWETNVVLTTVEIWAGGTTRNLAFNANWKTIGDALPATLAANKVAWMEIRARGQSETNVHVRFTAQP